MRAPLVALGALVAVTDAAPIRSVMMIRGRVAAQTEGTAAERESCSGLRSTAAPPRLSAEQALHLARMSSLRKQLEECIALPAGWNDDPENVAANTAAAELARLSLDALSESMTFAPDLVEPDAAGGIALAWHREDRCAYITATNRGNVILTLVDYAPDAPLIPSAAIRVADVPDAAESVRAFLG